MVRKHFVSNFCIFFQEKLNFSIILQSVRATIFRSFITIANSKKKLHWMRMNENGLPMTSRRFVPNAIFFPIGILSLKVRLDDLLLCLSVKNHCLEKETFLWQLDFVHLLRSRSSICPPCLLPFCLEVQIIAM